MKVAKEQRLDLNQTRDFLGNILSGDVEKPRSNPSPTESNSGPRLPNGRPKIPKIDAISRFSDPPAPPPQQPLPEKPDGSRSSPSDSVSHAFLKRTDTEKPRSGISNSPTSAQSSQILSLVEALSSAKKEIDSQGVKVKMLEDQLRQERTAKERAEERAKRLEHLSRGEGPVSEVEAAFEPPSESDDSTVMVLDNAQAREANKPWNEANSTEKGTTTEAKDDKLQQRLDLLVAEMNEMKLQMESYRHRAETAESEAASTRVSLTDMIKRLRHENVNAAVAAELRLDEHAGHMVSEGEQSEGTTAVGPRPKAQQNGQAVPPGQLQHIERAVTTVLAGSSNGGTRNELLAQSAPYASMLGVVLLGMGLMAYLNTWQKVEKIT